MEVRSRPSEYHHHSSLWLQRCTSSVQQGRAHTVYHLACSFYFLSLAPTDISFPLSFCISPYNHPTFWTHPDISLSLSFRLFLNRFTLSKPAEYLYLVTSPMDGLFGHRRRRSHNYNYNHHQSNMIAVESYSQTPDPFARGRSQYKHPLTPFPPGGMDDPSGAAANSGVKSPSAASRIFSSMRRSLSQSAPHKKREASVAVSSLSIACFVRPV